MLEGITVLSESVHEFTINDQIEIIVACLIMALLLGVIAWLSMESIGFGLVFSIFMFILLVFLTTSGNEIKSTYTIYKVTISDEVNFIEFTNRYEVLSQDGQIYEIREKETE